MNAPALRREPLPVPRLPAPHPLPRALPSGGPPALPARERPGAPPLRPQLALPTQRTRRAPAREVVAALLLVVAWALLWGFFVTAVAEPGARLAARTAAHPSVAPAR